MSNKQHSFIYYIHTVEWDTKYGDNVHIFIKCSELHWPRKSKRSLPVLSKLTSGQKGTQRIHGVMNLLIVQLML